MLSSRKLLGITLALLIVVGGVSGWFAPAVANHVPDPVEDPFHEFVDTRCDTHNCANVQIDTDLDADNRLDTQAAGGEAGKLFWGIHEVCLANKPVNGCASGGDITEIIAGQGLTGDATFGSAALNVGAGAGLEVDTDEIRIAANGVTASMLKSSAGTDSDRAVTTNHIRDLAINAFKLANNAVTSAKLQSHASDDAQRAVTTDHIQNSAVTSDKLRSHVSDDIQRAVTRDHIRDNAVSAAKIGEPCAVGQILKRTASSTWACDADANSGGTVTSVATSEGLSGGTITGTGTIGLSLAAGGGLSKLLGLNSNELGLQACTTGQILKRSASSTWTCDTDVDTNSGGDITEVTTAAGSGLSGGDTSGTVSLALTPPSTTTLGGVKSKTCNGTDKLVALDTAGAFTCAADVDTDTNSGGTVTRVGTGLGLQGGDITGAGDIDLRLNAASGLSKTLGANSNELGIADNGVTSGKLADDIGLGTDSPADRLHLLKASGEPGMRLERTTDVAQVWRTFIDGAGKFRLFDVTDNRAVMTWDGDGNVGIGTTDPAPAEATTGRALFVESDVRSEVSIVGNRVQAGEELLGSLNFLNTNGATRTGAAEIRGLAVGLNRDTSRLGFYTTNAGSFGERMRISEAGNVGVGTSNPQQRLDVKSPAAGSGAFVLTKAASNDPSIEMYEGGASGGGGVLNMFKGDGTNGVHFAAATGQENWFNNGGNVGIGTASPGAKLDVSVNTNGDGVRVSGTSPLILAQANSGGDPVVESKGTIGGLHGILRATGQNGAVVTNLVATRDTSDSGGKWRANVGLVGTATNNDFDVLTNDTVRMTVKNDGKVGIGTTTPQGTLHANGRVLTASGEQGGGYYAYNEPGGSRPLISQTDGASGFETTIYNTHGPGSTNPIRFVLWDGSGNNEKMRVQGNGNVGIGTDGPSGKLHIKGVTSGNDLTALVLENTDPNAHTWSVGSLMSGTSNRFSIGDTTAGVERMVIRDGKVGVGTTNPNSALQVVGNYLQLPYQETTPPGADCDESSELGRMVVVAGPLAPGIHICTRDASNPPAYGWQIR